MSTTITSRSARPTIRQAPHSGPDPAGASPPRRSSAPTSPPSAPKNSSLGDRMSHRSSSEPRASEPQHAQIQRSSSMQRAVPPKAGAAKDISPESVLEVGAHLSPAQAKARLTRPTVNSRATPRRGGAKAAKSFDASGGGFSPRGTNPSPRAHTPDIDAAVKEAVALAVAAAMAGVREEAQAERLASPTGNPIRTPQSPEKRLPGDVFPRDEADPANGSSGSSSRESRSFDSSRAEVAKLDVWGQVELKKLEAAKKLEEVKRVTPPDLDDSSVSSLGALVVRPPSAAPSPAPPARQNRLMGSVFAPLDSPGALVARRVSLDSAKLSALEERMKHLEAMLVEERVLRRKAEDNFMKLLQAHSSAPSVPSTIEFMDAAVSHEVVPAPPVAPAVIAADRPQGALVFYEKQIDGSLMTRYTFQVGDSHPAEVLLRASTEECKQRASDREGSAVAMVRPARRASATAALAQSVVSALTATPAAANLWVQPAKNAFLNLQAKKKTGVPKEAAALLRSAAAAVEPKVTSLLAEIAKRSGGELVGLDFRFKDVKSLEKKIERDMHEANLRLLEEMEVRRQDKSGDYHKQQKKGRKRMSVHRRNSMQRGQSMMMIEAPSQTELRPDIPRSASVPEGIEKELSRDREKNGRTNESFAWTPRGGNISQSAEFGQLQKESEDIAAKVLAKAQAKAEAVEAAVAAENSEVNVEEIVWKISDALRYTIVFDTSVYTVAVAGAVESLEAAGFKPVSLKNYWGEGDGYQGINDVFAVPCALSPKGVVKVEVQFHTQASFDHKMKDAHIWYEEFRETRDPDRKKELWKMSVDAADAIAVPDNVLSLPELKTQHMPIESTLYEELILSRAMKLQPVIEDLVRKACANLLLPSMNDQILGLDTSLKPVATMITSTVLSPSRMEQRFAHAVAVTPNGDPKIASLSVSDALHVTVVLKDAVYTRATGLILERLFSNVAKSKSGLVKRVSTTKQGPGGSNRGSGSGGAAEEAEAAAAAAAAEAAEVETDAPSSPDEVVPTLDKVNNWWNQPLVLNGIGPTGGIGLEISGTCPGEDDGVDYTPDDAYPFVLSFHTPSSSRAATGIRTAWAAYRGATTSALRQSALEKARTLANEVGVPPGARTAFAGKLDESASSSSESEEDDDGSIG